MQRHCQSFVVLGFVLKSLPYKWDEVKMTDWRILMLLIVVRMAYAAALMLVCWLELLMELR